ncbi:hypothetical protein BGY98DRAFT_1093027 [Russula aff. rugulosa BPL654]|nr:hypothetical protein BGY98DRAFT_1093027 [Russula aff. rugulosa BPL654]
MTVIVLIDEYETSNNRAYEHSYSNETSFRPPYLRSLAHRDLPASVEARTGGNYVDLRLLHKRKSQADVIELKPSEKEEDMENDASKAPEF